VHGDFEPKPQADGEPPVVSVIVSALNAEATLPRLLAGVLDQDLDGAYEVIVVDNGSRDSTGAIAARSGSRVQLLRNAVTTGVGEARNHAVAAARASNLAFTDSDCFPTRTWLSEGLREIAHADLVQGRVEPDPIATRSPFDRTLSVRSEDGYYQTANLFVRRELFDLVGGFEDWIVERGGDGPFGWEAPSDGRPVRAARRPMGEDVLFAWRARRLGARTKFANAAVVYHAVFPTSPREFVRYRRHWRHMPALASRIPEMREHAFYRRWFLDRRSARFDLALVGATTAVVRREALWVALALPYARWLRGERRTERANGNPLVFLAVSVAADGATFVALAVGSFAWRALLL